MHHITIDGISYHCTFKWKEEWDDYDESEYELIVDEKGNPVPSDECICAAWEPSECCCGALDRNGWNDYETVWPLDEEDE